MECDKELSVLKNEINPATSDHNHSRQEEARPKLERKKTSGRLVKVKEIVENEQASAKDERNKILNVTFKTPEIDQLWDYKI